MLYRTSKIEICVDTKCSYPLVRARAKYLAIACMVQAWQYVRSEATEVINKTQTRLSVRIVATLTTTGTLMLLSLEYTATCLGRYVSLMHQSTTIMKGQQFR